MSGGRRHVLPTRATVIAAFFTAITIAATATVLLIAYPSMPDLLPVHFVHGVPNGWQFRTVPRVIAPVAVQATLAITLWSVAALLLSRPHGALEAAEPDVRAAAAAAEAVVLIALIWVAFQAFAGVTLAWMWMSHGSSLPLYTPGELVGAALSIGVAIRAQRRLGRPVPRPFVPAHWRLGQLYKNPNDPALFVPTRDGRRWTLNFGRPVAPPDKPS